MLEYGAQVVSVRVAVKLLRELCHGNLKQTMRVICVLSAISGGSKGVVSNNCRSIKKQGAKERQLRS